MNRYENSIENAKKFLSHGMHKARNLLEEDVRYIRKLFKEA